MLRRCVAAGPDGSLWFTEGNGDKICRITTGAVTPTPGAPTGIPALSPGMLAFFTVILVSAAMLLIRRG